MHRPIIPTYPLFPIPGPDYERLELRVRTSQCFHLTLLCIGPSDTDARWIDQLCQDSDSPIANFLRQDSD